MIKPTRAVIELDAAEGNPAAPKPYGIISLFDGCSSVHDIITEPVGRPPTVFIAAENDLDIRKYIAAKNQWNLHGTWFQQGSSHYIYLRDVDDLLRHSGALLRQAVE